MDSSCQNPACLNISTSGKDIRLSTCGKCKNRKYCSVFCQKQDWPSHKSTCSKLITHEATETINSSSIGIPVHDQYLAKLNISHVDLIGIFPPKRDSNSNSKFYVGDGTSKVSQERLFTFAPSTCVVVAVIGKSQVFLQHLSGWNAPGNPYSQVPRILKDILPKDFEFVSGYIIPGPSLNIKLLPVYNPSQSIMQELLWENFVGLAWKSKFSIISGCTLKLVIEVTVKNGLKFYKSLGADLMPDMPDCKTQ